MKAGRTNRDLLVIARNGMMMDDDAMRREVELLHEILYGIESLQTLCEVNEVFDLNRYRTIRKPHLVARAIREKQHKAFIFICNKN